MHYIPLDLMYGEKPAEDSTTAKYILPGNGHMKPMLWKRDKRLGRYFSCRN